MPERPHHRETFSCAPLVRQGYQPYQRSQTKPDGSQGVAVRYKRKGDDIPPAAAERSVQRSVSWTTDRCPNRLQPVDTALHSAHLSWDAKLDRSRPPRPSFLGSVSGPRMLPIFKVTTYLIYFEEFARNKGEGGGKLRQAQTSPLANSVRRTKHPKIGSYHFRSSEEVERLGEDRRA